MRGVYRSRSLQTAGRELAKYRLDVVGAQEVRWDNIGAKRLCFVCGKGVKSSVRDRIFCTYENNIGSQQSIFS